jgi:uncharacterized membrane protein YoaK (UPF0700 family)
MATPVALAACAGAVDLLGFAGLHGAFASIVTGNLVVAGLGFGSVDDSVVVPPLVAVLGYVVGVAAWQWMWRRLRTAVISPLVVEFGFLLAVAIGWWVADTHPAYAASLTLLGVASLAMGGQSVVALRLHAATTYLTGTLTGAVQDLVTGKSGGRVTALGQLVALASGATLSAALLVHQRWAVPLLPVCLLAIAVGARTMVGRLGRRR